MCLAEADAGLEARDHIGVVSLVAKTSRGAQRHESIGGFDKPEAAGRYACHSVTAVAQPNDAAQHLRIGMEAAPPQAVAENDGLRSVGLSFGAVEVAAQSQRDAQRAEEAGGHDHDADGFLLFAGGQGLFPNAAKTGRGRKRRGVPVPELILGNGDTVAPLASHVDDLPRLRIRQRA